MSFITIFTAGLAAMAPFAAALTAAKGDPSGNPIYEPGKNSIVPVGKPFEITWEPTTEGKVSLVLLHGPSTNVVPIATIADSIDNSGKYSWTPSTDIAPNTTYYGLEIIVEGTGQYQYSTQFGISNPDYKGDASSSSSTTNTNIKIPLTSEIGDIVASATALLGYGSSAVSSIASEASSKVSEASSKASAIAGSASGVVSSAVASASAKASSAASAASGNASSVSSALANASSSLSSVIRTATGSSATGSSTRSASASLASSTGGAGKIGAGLGSLALAAGVAAYVL